MLRVIIVVAVASYCYIIMEGGELDDNIRRAEHGPESYEHPTIKFSNHTGAALRENADISILGFKMGIKIIIFDV